MTPQLSKSSKLNIVVAHALEAKPLITLLGLTRLSPQTTAFPVYANDLGTCLIVSGMGKLAAASASSYLAGLQHASSNATPAWLNFGIAGHQSAPVGSGYLAKKITDRASGISFYPPLLLNGFDYVDVVTVDEPEFNYPDKDCYEMEAFGFYATASRFVTAELVQVFKIISDSPSAPARLIDAARIALLFAGVSSQIVELTTQLAGMSEEFATLYSSPPVLDQLAEKYRLSATHQSQLRRLYQRYQALELGGEWQILSCREHTTSQKLIRVLETRLTELSG